jgi:hypothetical protein
MRNHSDCAFWENAANQLPAQVRARYTDYFRRAEQWELVLDEVIELASRLRARAARVGRTLKAA